MSKIDVSLIEGYSGMSAEEKLKALEELDMPEPDYSGYVKKDVYDKTASELADKKKQLNAQMTEDEAKRQKELEERQELQEKYDKLLNKVTVSEHKAQFLSLGYDEKLASESAEALAKGDLAKVFANQKKHLESFEKNIRAELLKDTPKPLTGEKTEGVTTKEDLRKMDPLERLKFSQEHPEEYREIYEGGNDDGTHDL